MLEKWVTGYYKVPVFAPMGHYALFCLGLFYIVTIRIQVNFPGSKASPCVQSKHIQILCLSKKKKKLLNLKFELEACLRFDTVSPAWLISFHGSTTWLGIEHKLRDKVCDSN